MRTWWVTDTKVRHGFQVVFAEQLFLDGTFTQHLCEARKAMSDIYCGYFYSSKIPEENWVVSA